MDIVIIKQSVLPPRPKIRGSQHLREKNGSGTPLKDCYSIVEGETYADCRKEIFQITEGKYSMDYPYEDYAHMIEEYNLKQVPLQPHR